MNQDKIYVADGNRPEDKSGVRGLPQPVPPLKDGRTELLLMAIRALQDCVTKQEEDGDIVRAMPKVKLVLDAFDHLMDKS